MQFLFLNSWISSTKLLQCVFEDNFFQHLAQIKHILPEAMKLEYVRCSNSYLQRNKWDLCISLLPMPATGAAAIDGDGDESELLQGDLFESSKLIYPKKETHM
jgi:hypothetical protein